MKLAMGILVLIACGRPAPAAGPLTASADGLTVYDSAHNVTWLADMNAPLSNHFGLPVCSGALASSQACINPNGSLRYTSAAAWVAAMNAANYLGHSNWQLPTTPQVDRNCGRTGPAGGSFGFGCTAGALDSVYNALGLAAPATAVPIPPNTLGPFSNVQPYLYWSQTSAGATQGNASFSFATGWQGANTLPNFLYVLPMIAGRLPGTPAPAGTGLAVSADGQTVYDPETEITWLANANLAATNSFGLPPCAAPTTPALCVAADGAMTWASAVQWLANMNSAAYLGQAHWQAPAIDPSCPGYGCMGSANPMGNLFYAQLGLAAGAAAVAVPDLAVGPFHNIQPYLYWTCGGATPQNACDPAGPAPNFEYSYSFGSGFQGTDLLANSLFATAYFVGARTPSTGPVIALVANAEGELAPIAPNTWVEIKGAGLAPAGDVRVWKKSDLVNGQMPTQLDQVSVTVNGIPAYLYYISPGQIDILTPTNAMSGQVNVVVDNNGAQAPFMAQAQAIAPSLFVLGGGPYAAALHAGGALVGPPALYPGATPARPGETIMLYANGFGPTSVPVASGSLIQMGTLAVLPVVRIGTNVAAVAFAGLVEPGQFQFNVTVPPNAPDGDQLLTVSYGAAVTQPGTLITIQK